MDGMTDEVHRLFGTLVIRAHEAGWDLTECHVSKQGRSAYLWFARHGELVVRVRVSDHRSATFKTTKGPSGSSARFFSLLTHRPGSLVHCVSWLRAHSPVWPPKRPGVPDGSLAPP